MLVLGVASGVEYHVVSTPRGVAAIVSGWTKAATLGATAKGDNKKCAVGIQGYQNCSPKEDV